MVEKVSNAGFVKVFRVRSPLIKSNLHQSICGGHGPEAHVSARERCL